MGVASVDRAWRGQADLVTRRPDEGFRTGLSRRSLLSVAVGGAVFVYGLRSSRAETPLSPPATPTKLGFRIVRQKSPVGYHRIAIAPNGDSFVVTTSIRITVKVAFVTAFKFEHDCSEVWTSGRLQSLDASTNNDGDKLRVSGKATNNGVEMKGPSGPFTAPGDALTTSCLWSPAILAQSQIIDTQNGGMIGLVAKGLGADKVKISNATLTAERYDLITPYLNGNLWYDSSNRWVKSAFEWQGEQIDYDLEA